MTYTNHDLLVTATTVSKEVCDELDYYGDSEEQLDSC